MPEGVPGVDNESTINAFSSRLSSMTGIIVIPIYRHINGMINSA